MEYLTAFEEIPSARQMSWIERRGDLVDRYAWAIPNETAISRLVDLSPIVEMGAGSGYWAYEIERRGGTVHAYDNDPPDETWAPVTVGTPDVLSGYTEPLLLCWPPYGEPMAREAIEEHCGETVVYIGEIEGCTADSEFHRLLDWEYSLEEVIDIPSYDGIHDNMFIYRKS